jgi:hypothetical protein
MTRTYKFCADTHWYLFCSEYPVQWIEHSLTCECPNHVSVRHIKPSWIELSITQSFGLRWQEQTLLYTPIELVKLKKVNVKSHKQYENITYEFIAYRTQRSILFCCTETNNILRVVSSSEDAVFSMRTFTWSWWLPVSLCRSAIGLDVEPYGLHLGARLTSTCLRSRHLHAVERHTRTMVFWTFFLLVPPHIDDWHRHLDRCHKSESSDHRIWWRSRWQVL